MEIASVEEDIEEAVELQEDTANLVPRAPVVTIMDMLTMARHHCSMRSGKRR